MDELCEYEPLPEWDNRAPLFPNPRRGKAAVSPLLSLLLYISRPTLRIPILVKRKCIPETVPEFILVLWFCFPNYKISRVCPHRDLDTDVHSGIIHNSPDL